MSDDKNTIQNIDNSSGFAVRLFPGFFVTVFLVLAATGHCGVCGLDRDYVGEAISR